jgi:hypothetical protein
LSFYASADVAPAEVSVAISRLPRGARYADTCLAAAPSSRPHAEGCVRTAVVDRLTRLTERKAKTRSCSAASSAEFEITR